MIVDIPVLERFSANSCFVILFCTTVYYWSKIIFTSHTTYTKTGLVGFGSATFFLTIHLFVRWYTSGHFPLSNLYESLLFLTWCVLIFHIYIENVTKTTFLGVLTAPALLCLIAFTDFSLPADLQKSSPLVPALQSNWLIMHVTVMIASYAALLLGCLVSIAYLIFFKFLKNQVKLNESTLIETSFTNTLSSSNLYNFNSKTNFLGKLDLAKEAQLNFDQSRISSSNLSNLETPKFTESLVFLDNLSYRTIGIGFCFLTLGILSGAVWANETWGNYWSWDPKETWAFITWLTFACYLHSRLIGGWTGFKPALIASFGFVMVWVCYLGVNLLGQGLHSYGFLKL